MDRCLHQQSLVARVHLNGAALGQRCVDGANRPTLGQPNDDYYYSIGHYEPALKLSDTQAAPARS